MSLYYSPPFYDIINKKKKKKSYVKFETKRLIYIPFMVSKNRTHSKGFDRIIKLQSGDQRSFIFSHHCEEYYPKRNSQYGLFEN